MGNFSNFARRSAFYTFGGLVGADPDPSYDLSVVMATVTWLIGRFDDGQMTDFANLEEFQTFMEQITGNFGSPSPVEDILAAYPGLTEDMIDLILASIET